jgi:uncharacterized membrane protein YbhN (UPF0104 family)
VWLLVGLLTDERAERSAGRLTALPKVGHSAAEFWRACWMYRRRTASVLTVLAMSWVGFVLMFYSAALTLWGGTDSGQKVPDLMQHFLIVPVGLIINAMPLFPGGAGSAEAGFGGLYEWVGATAAAGGSLCGSGPRTSRVPLSGSPAIR